MTAFERYRWRRDTTTHDCRPSNSSDRQQLARLCETLADGFRRLTERRSVAWERGESVFDVSATVPDVNPATRRELTFANDVRWTDAFYSAIDNGRLRPEMVPASTATPTETLVVCPVENATHRPGEWSVHVGDDTISLTVREPRPSHDLDFLTIVVAHSGAAGVDTRLELVGPKRLELTSTEYDPSGQQRCCDDVRPETAALSERQARKLVATRWTTGTMRQFALFLEDVRDAVSLPTDSGPQYRSVDRLTEALPVDATYHPALGDTILTRTRRATNRVRRSRTRIDTSTGEAAFHRSIGRALGYPDDAIAHFAAGVHRDARIPSGSRMAETAVRLQRDGVISPARLRSLRLLPYATTGARRDVLAALGRGRAFATVLQRLAPPLWPPDTPTG